MRRGEGHFAPTIARGELNVQEFRNASFPYVVVSITRCDAGCLAGFVTGSRSRIEVEMIRLEWSDVVHWYAGPDYDGLVPLDDA
jgi:hypothetical protein